jgi:transcriptional regulator with XRE-family HTH domain
MASSELLDTAKLAAAVRAKRGDIGLRDTVATIEKVSGKISHATLSRVEQGKAPDVDTFLRLCRWLGMPPSEFSMATNGTRHAATKQSTQELVEAHLRADKTLSADTTHALVEMIRLAYRQESKK